MAKKTNKEYKSDLKNRIKDVLVANYDPNRPPKGLRYWVEFNKSEKNKFDDELKKNGTTVEG